MVPIYVIVIIILLIIVIVLLSLLFYTKKNQSYPVDTLKPTKPVPSITSFQTLVNNKPLQQPSTSSLLPTHTEKKSISHDPVKSDSFFSDKMELNEGQDLYDLYLNQKKPVSQDFYTNATNQLHQKAATLRSTFRNSLKLQPKQITKHHVLHLFDQPPPIKDTSTLFSDEPTITMIPTSKSELDIPLPPTPLPIPPLPPTYCVIQLDQEDDHDLGDSSVDAAKRVIRSASRKSKTRSTQYDRKSLSKHNSIQFSHGDPKSNEHAPLTDDHYQASLNASIFATKNMSDKKQLDSQKTELESVEATEIRRALQSTWQMNESESFYKLDSPVPTPSFSSSTARTAISLSHRLSIDSSRRNSSGANSTATALRIGDYSKTWNGRMKNKQWTTPYEEEESLPQEDENERAFFSTMRKGQKSRGHMPLWTMADPEKTPAQKERDRYLGGDIN